MGFIVYSCWNSFGGDVVDWLSHKKKNDDFFYGRLSILSADFLLKSKCSFSDESPKSP